MLDEFTGLRPATRAPILNETLQMRCRPDPGPSPATRSGSSLRERSDDAHSTPSGQRVGVRSFSGQLFEIGHLILWKRASACHLGRTAFILRSPSVPIDRTQILWTSKVKPSRKSEGQRPGEWTLPLACSTHLSASSEVACKRASQNSVTGRLNCQLTVTLPIPGVAWSEAVR